jgi:hypothetical protein
MAAISYGIHCGDPTFRMGTNGKIDYSVFMIRAGRLALAVGLFALAIRSQAQNFSIDWFTIDGGGGTSADEVFTVSGTLGQADAGGPMVGEGFVVEGGFWSIIAAVQMPDAPELSIQVTTANTAVISWDSAATGFGLQQNNDLNTTNWVASTNAVTDNGSTKFIIINPPSGNRFYRLFKP